MKYLSCKFITQYVNRYITELLLFPIEINTGMFNSPDVHTIEY